MGKTFQRHALTIVDILIDDYLQAAEMHRLFHFCLRLFAQVLRQIIERGNALARRTRSFPATERLIAWPRTSGGALRTIHVGNSGLNVVEEIGRIVITAVET